MEGYQGGDLWGSAKRECNRREIGETGWNSLVGRGGYLQGWDRETELVLCARKAKVGRW